MAAKKAIGQIYSIRSRCRIVSDGCIGYRWDTNASNASNTSDSSDASDVSDGSDACDVSDASDTSNVSDTSNLSQRPVGNNKEATIRNLRSSCQRKWRWGAPAATGATAGVHVETSGRSETKNIEVKRR
jgi:hypothetical protein